MFMYCICVHASGLQWLVGAEGEGCYVQNLAGPEQGILV